jgi:predicted ATP-binding protein involved in virulence
MNIQSVRIKNFRCFSEEKWLLDEHFNVLIGNNATGKTSLLDAISIGIGSFFLGIDDVYAKTILYKDIRKNTFIESREYQLPCEIELSGFLEDSREPLTWQRSVLSSRGNTRRDTGTNKLAEVASSLQKAVRNNEKVSLPVFRYYGTGRLWSSKKNIKTISLSSRLDGYKDAIEPLHTSNAFISWMKTRTLTELQSQVKDEALLLIKATVTSFLVKNEKIDYDVKLDSIVLDKLTSIGTSKAEWSELSDGYRNIIAMAADIAYRCYTLNNHFGLYAAEKSKGVILIDEIDLHLHPSWQRTVVESFKKAFPNLQFIVTTHSPFIIQSLKNKELIDLQGKDLEDDYNRQGLEEIVEKEMHVENPNRSEKYVEKLKAAEEYYNLLEQYKDKPIPIQVQSNLDNIETKFSNDPAYVALLKSERKAKSHNEAGK